MIFLKCLLCGGEIEIVDNDRSINRKIKCKKCGFSNVKKSEILVLKNTKEF